MDTRIVQIGQIWKVEQLQRCPCPDCGNVAHSTWRGIGGSVTKAGAAGIAKRNGELVDERVQVPSGSHMEDI